MPAGQGRTVRRPGPGRRVPAVRAVGTLTAVRVAGVRTGLALLPVPAVPVRAGVRTGLALRVGPAVRSRVPRRAGRTAAPRPPVTRPPGPGDQQADSRPEAAGPSGEVPVAAPPSLVYSPDDDRTDEGMIGRGAVSCITDTDRPWGREGRASFTRKLTWLTIT